MEDVVNHTAQIVYDSIMSIVEDKYPEIHYDHLQTVFPPYVSFFWCVHELMISVIFSWESLAGQG